MTSLLVFLVIYVVLPALLILVCGFGIGRYIERQHLNDLDRREKETSDVTVTQVKSFPGGCDSSITPRTLYGEVVIGSDYLKRFLMYVKNILGGELTSYQTMITRARREALLRIVEEAKENGYNAVGNVRMYTTYLGGSAASTEGNDMKIAEIIVVGTAYHTSEEEHREQLAG